MPYSEIGDRVRRAVALEQQRLLDAERHQREQAAQARASTWQRWLRYAAETHCHSKPPEGCEPMERT